LDIATRPSFILRFNKWIAGFLSGSNFDVARTFSSASKRGILVPGFRCGGTGDWKIARTRRLESLRSIIPLYALAVDITHPARHSGQGLILIRRPKMASFLGNRSSGNARLHALVIFRRGHILLPCLREIP
jgi:hypothetical protein